MCNNTKNSADTCRASLLPCVGDTASRSAPGLRRLLLLLFQHLADEVVVRVNANVGRDLHGPAPDLLGIQIGLVDQRTRRRYKGTKPQIHMHSVRPVPHEQARVTPSSYQERRCRLSRCLRTTTQHIPLVSSLPATPQQDTIRGVGRLTDDAVVRLHDVAVARQRVRLLAVRDNEDRLGVIARVSSSPRCGHSQWSNAPPGCAGTSLSARPWRARRTRA